uniref:Uncharacterized protein n=1 Tax=Rhizophora mucronata TaxID=61149 RepID=A0A2P2NHZ9_RHIMU
MKAKGSNDTSECNTFDTARAPTLVEMSKMQAPVAIPSAETTLNQPRFFSSKLMNSCVVASERTRAICSLIIASLVVIAAVDYPLLGIDLVSSQSVIASRPLYMVLLMDVTIVLTRMYRERGNAPEDAEDARLIHNEDRHNWTEAIKLLERGLAIYQAFRGAFIDCSIYLVVVICGLSLI